MILNATILEEHQVLVLLYTVQVRVCKQSCSDAIGLCDAKVMQSLCGCIDNFTMCLLKENV